MKPTIGASAIFHPSVGSDFGATAARITQIHGDVCVDLEYEREEGVLVGASRVPVLAPSAARPSGGYFCLLVEQPQAAPVLQEAAPAPVPPDRLPPSDGTPPTATAPAKKTKSTGHRKTR
jgi:hypothetical protein